MQTLQPSSTEEKIPAATPAKMATPNAGPSLEAMVLTLHLRHQQAFVSTDGEDAPPPQAVKVSGTIPISWSTSSCDVEIR